MDDETYLRSAHQLSQDIRGRAAECESLRRLPDETVECYQRSGLLRALQPRRWGGFELSPLSFFEAVGAGAPPGPGGGGGPGAARRPNLQARALPPAATPGRLAAGP